MAYLETFDFFWLVTLFQWGVVVWLGLRNGLIRRYSLVFVYVFWGIFGTGIALGIAQSRFASQSETYALLYFSEALISTSLAAVVILRIYAIIHPFSWRRDWHLALVPLFLGGLILFDPNPMRLSVKLVNAGHVTLMYFGCATLFEMRRSREVDLGWNLKMVLLAVTLPAGFFTFIFMGYTMALPIPYEGVRLWSKGVSVAYWLILAAAMIEYSPPRRLEAKRNSAGGARVVDSGRESKPSTENLEVVRL